MKMKLCPFVLLLLPGLAWPAESRRWVGADYFAMPLHDWVREDGNLVARPASFGGAWGNQISRLCHATSTLGGTGTFTTRFQVYHLDFDAHTPKPTDQFPGFPVTLPLR